MIVPVAQLLNRARRVVALTGAGISAESGVPTFRGKEGIWEKFKPEELATMTAFMANSKLVWEWYTWRRELIAAVQPNPGHLALRELEELLPEFALITQNVDNLHRLAGSTNILELHGNIYRNKCVDCQAQFDPNASIDPRQIPVCPECGGKIRPDVVWFGEMLDEQTIQEAFWQAEQADVFFSIGTSALVHPAASLPLVAKRHGATLIEINPEKTALSGLVDFYFGAPSGEVLPQLIAALRHERSNQPEPDAQRRV